MVASATKYASIGACKNAGATLSKTWPKIQQYLGYKEARKQYAILAIETPEIHFRNASITRHIV